MTDTIWKCVKDTSPDLKHSRKNYVQVSKKTFKKVITNSSLADIDPIQTQFQNDDYTTSKTRLMNELIEVTNLKISNSFFNK